MKYAIAFDKGAVYNSRERFKRIDLDFVNPSLNGNDNLRALCAFTMTFQDCAMLKDFLIKKNGRLAKYSACKLVLVNLQNREHGRVIYSSDINYFKFEDVAQLILRSTSNRDFLSQFCTYFQNKKYMQQYIYDLKGAVYESQQYVVYDAVRKLLYRACYNSKGILDYRYLYKVLTCALAILERLNSKSVEEEVSQKKEEMEFQNFEWPLTEEQQFEKEWLEERAILREHGRW